jgi:hypothetical protein
MKRIAKTKTKRSERIELQYILNYLINYDIALEKVVALKDQLEEAEASLDTYVKAIPHKIAELKELLT